MKEFQVENFKDKVWKKFLMSKKRHLLITGARGAGKTTLRKMLAGEKTPGLITVLKKDGHQESRAILMKASFEDKWNPIGHFVEGFMHPIEKNIEIYGVEILKKLLKRNEETVFIDEIGFVELDCSRYCQMILRVFEEKKVIAVLRQMDNPFHNALKNRPDSYVFDFDTEKKA